MHPTGMYSCYDLFLQGLEGGWPPCPPWIRYCFFIFLIFFRAYNKTPVLRTASELVIEFRKLTALEVAAHAFFERRVVDALQVDVPEARSTHARPCVVDGVEVAHQTHQSP